MKNLSSFSVIIILSLALSFGECHSHHEDHDMEQSDLQIKDSETDSDKKDTIFTISSKNMIACWKHAHEQETSPDMLIFKTCSDEFPPSRFRQSLTLLEDGHATYLELASNDRHFQAEGKWQLAGNILTIRNDQGTVRLQYKVVTSSPTSMKLLKM